MISKLFIKNLALIDSVTLDFKSGFSVFTGETGAGKSILIGAIGLVLGERASLELIRSGAKETEITGVFELESLASTLMQIIDDSNISIEDNTLIIRRIIAKNGRNRILINQIPVPLSTLKNIGNYLVDLHGQHEHQSLLRPETASMIINSLPKINSVWNNYCKQFIIYTKLKTQLENFDKTAQELTQKRDFIEYQYTELSDLNLHLNEDKELEQEYTRLSSVNERLECITSISTIIDGNDTQISIDRQINDIQKSLIRLEKFDSSATPWIGDIENTRTFLSELNQYCNSYLKDDDTVSNPLRIEQINTRLAKIQRLSKKYKCTCNELLKTTKNLKEQLDSIENSNADRTYLEKKVIEAKDICLKTAQELSQIRKIVTSQFDISISDHMKRLGFSGGQWRTTFVKEKDIVANGMEDITFEVRTNTGEPFLPLIKTASGGEISRLMLAIKTVLSSKDKIPVLIFDEVDTGIGGLLAKEVAKSLYALSESHQVFCISHLHQIASIADHHYKVYKKTEKERTITHVSFLNDIEKIEEISRMLGSDSSLSKKHAMELLDQKKK